MSVPLKKVVEELRERGEEEEADYIELMIPFELMIIHNFSYDEGMDMSLDDIEAWYQIPAKPAKYEGWSFWWGEAA